MAVAAAAAAQKRRVIGAAWTTIAGAGAFCIYRTIRDFEENSPVLREAVHFLSTNGTARGALGGGELLVARWPRQSHVDQAAGLARASFEVRSDAGAAFVVVSARRRAQAQKQYEEAMEEEDDEEALTGWRRYWSRPWEIKIWLLSKFQSKAPAAADGEPKEEPTWDLDSMFMLPGGDASSPAVLFGDPSSLPEYEALCMRRDGAAKGERSRRRLRIVTGGALMLAFIAGGARLLKSMRVSQSYGYVRRTLSSHTEIARTLGSRVVIQSSSGTFGKSFINAKLRLVGDGGAVADVSVAAQRTGVEPWRVSLARMSMGGLHYNLDKSQF